MFVALQMVNGAWIVEWMEKSSQVIVCTDSSVRLSVWVKGLCLIQADVDFPFSCFGCFACKKCYWYFIFMKQRMNVTAMCNLVVPQWSCSAVGMTPFPPPPSFCCYQDCCLLLFVGIWYRWVMQRYVSHVCIGSLWRFILRWARCHEMLQPFDCDISLHDEHEYEGVGFRLD